MAIAPVQSNEGTSTSATVTASFATAPTPGNLICIHISSDDYNGTPNAGWTQSAQMEQQTWHGGYLWWGFSDGSNSFQYTIGSATNSSWVLTEWSGVDTSSPYLTSAGQCGVTSASSYSTPGITPAAGDCLLIGQIGSSQESNVNMSADLTSWTNSFTHIRSSGPTSASGTRDSVGVAYRLVTANGSTSYSTGATYPFAKESSSGLIIAFKGATGGGTTDGAGAASGSGTASGIGNSLKPTVGSAAGSATATAVGVKIASSVGAASGSAAATAQGVEVQVVFDAPDWVASAAVHATTSSVNSTPAIPTSAQGDILILSAGCIASNTAFTVTKSGTDEWNEIWQGNVGANRAGFWWKRREASESAPTVTNSGRTSTNLLTSSIDAYTGIIASGTPIRNTQTVAQNSGAMLGSELVTEGRNSLAVTRFMRLGANSAAAPDILWTEDRDNGTSGGGGARYYGDSQVIEFPSTVPAVSRGGSTNNFASVTFELVGQNSDPAPPSRVWKRGMWVWDFADIVGNSGLEGQLLTACGDYDITDLYCYTTAAFVSGNTAAIQSFIEDATTAGVRIWGLDGAREYFADADGRTDLDANIQEIIDYNAASSSGQKFYGFHIDCEPADSGSYTAFHNGIASSALNASSGGVWQATEALDREYLMRDWVDMHEDILAVCHANGLQFATALPTWFDDYFGEPVVCTYDGVTQNVFLHIAARSDVISVMSYNTDPKNVISRTLYEFLGTGSAEIGFSAETHSGAGSGVSYADTAGKQTTAALFADLDILRNRFHGYPNVFFDNIHDWEGFKAFAGISSTQSGAGAATGTGSAAASGVAIAATTGASSGTASVSGAFVAIASGVANSAANSNVAGIGLSIASAAGIAAGTATVNGSSTTSTINSGAGSAAGTSSVSAVGRSTAASVGASTGNGAATATGRATAASTGAASGSGAATAAGRSTASSAGSAAGTANVNGFSQGGTASTGAASGTSTVTGAGASVVAAVGSAGGSALVAANGSGVIAAIGSASGSSTASGVGRSIQVAVGISAGFGVALSVGQARSEAVGAASGTSQALAFTPDVVPPADIRTARAAGHNRTAIAISPRRTAVA